MIFLVVEYGQGSLVNSKETPTETVLKIFRSKTGKVTEEHRQNHVMRCFEMCTH